MQIKTVTYCNMLRAHLSTLFFILMLLVFSLVFITSWGGKLGLWLGGLLSYALLAKWLRYEFQVLLPSGWKKIPLSLLKHRFGWSTFVVDSFQINESDFTIKIQFYLFRKPQIIISNRFWDSNQNFELKVLFIYFSELARIIDQQSSLKLIALLGNLFNFCPLPIFEETKLKALQHTLLVMNPEKTKTLIALHQCHFLNNKYKSNPSVIKYIKYFPKPNLKLPGVVYGK